MKSKHLTVKQFKNGKTQVTYNKVTSELIKGKTMLDDTCVENALKSCISLYETYIAEDIKHMNEDNEAITPAHTKMSKDMIKCLDKALKQNKKIQDYYAGC